MQWLQIMMILTTLQVVALLYYMLSYFPGGANGVRFVLKMAFGAFLNCMRGMQRAVTG